MENKNTTPPTQEQLDYQAREKRVWDAVSLRKPDRVPLACQDDYFSLRLGGVTSAEAYYEPERASKAYVDQVVKFNWDMVSTFGSFPGRVAETIGLKTIKWAGYNLPADLEFQYIEKEYMLADEYDQFLKDPGDFVVRTLWPRMAKELEPFGFFPPLIAMSHSWAPITDIAFLAGQPEVREMLEKLILVGEEMNKYQETLDQTTNALTEKGFPVMNALEAGAHAPFDWISDHLRGLKGTTMDMYYQPDKLKAAVEMVTDPIIENAIQTAKAMGEKVVGIPLHRAADPFMSNAHFAEFYWPGLKKLMLSLIDAGLTPGPYWGGAFNNRLEFLTELPPGKIWAHWDAIDLKKAKDKVGDILCFCGNIPPQLLISGTPEQNRDYVKNLIDTWDTGGLIIDGAASIPKESKFENVMAMTETVFDYGVY